MSETKKTYTDHVQDVFRGFDRLSPEERIRAILSIQSPDDQRFLSPFVEQQCKLKDVKVQSPTTTVVTFAFHVDRFYCNSSGNLHGGAQSMIFDMCTSIAMQAHIKGDFWINGGVSRTLTVNYLRPAPEGENLLLECEVVHMGKKLGLLQGVLRRSSDGAIISTCSHDKVALESKAGWKL